MSTSLENLGNSLQDLILDVAYGMVDAINQDPRRKKIDLNKIAKEANRNLKVKGIEFFRIYVDQTRKLDIEVHDSEEL